jgi:hypothetical protein
MIRPAFDETRKKEQRARDRRILLIVGFCIGASIVIWYSSLNEPTPQPPAGCVWVQQSNPPVCANE